MEEKKKPEKQELRNSIRRLREQMDAEEKRRRDRMIADRVSAHEAFLKAEKLLVYMHYGSEARTDEIINRALITGKQVYVPRVSGRKMDFYKIRSLNECAPGYRKIPEPPQEAELYVPAPEACKEPVLMILPGLAFDVSGNRIGYGGGFYDRYLTGYPDCVKMGIAYDFQYVGQIPAEENDIPVDYIVTDRRAVSIAGHELNRRK